jgi:predicted glycosyltransferase
MTHAEYFEFLKASGICIDEQTGVAYVPINSFMAGDKGAIESIELEKLVNATIKLCLEVALNTARTVEPDYLIEELTNTLTSLKVK